MEDDLRVASEMGQVVPKLTRTQVKSYPKNDTQVNSYPSQLVPKLTRTRVKSYPSQVVPHNARGMGAHADIYEMCE